jgi:hypothetical protein
MTIMSNRPKKAKEMTAHQQATKSRFLLAVEYAKRQMADPVLKAKYEPGPGSEFASAYIAAVTDYLRRAKRNDEVMKETAAPSEPAIIMNTGTDKIDAKADAGTVVNEIAPPPGLRDTDLVRRHIVTKQYPISTVILSSTSIVRCSQAAAKLPRVSGVCFLWSEPVRTLLQRDPLFARAGPGPPLSTKFS